MMMPKCTTLALVCASLLSNAFAFQQHCDRRCPRLHSSSSSSLPKGLTSQWRPSAAPSYLRLDSRALPFVDDETYPNILPPSPKGVIFDMDGTLIRHAIDFAAMRRRIYAVVDEDSIGKDLPRDCVLAMHSKLSPEGQRKCQVIFDDIEQRALDGMKVMPGGPNLVLFLLENGLKCAVLTRNLEKNVRPMEEMYLKEMDADFSIDELFHPIVARDTRLHPDEEPLKAKPHPDGILHICQLWGCDPSEVVMVGDSANDDMTAANRAGCGGAVLLTQPGGEQLDTDSGYDVGSSDEDIVERTPSLRVESLLELKKCFEMLLIENDFPRESEGREQATKSVEDSLLYTSE